MKRAILIMIGSVVIGTCLNWQYLRAAQISVPESGQCENNVDIESLLEMF